jgi:hypothetical protein
LSTSDDSDAPGEILDTIARLRVALPGMKGAESEGAILALIEPWAGSPSAARDWILHFIPSLGTSPAELLADGRGRGALVLNHLQAIAHGGYA